jgi:hypothetical protein
MRARSISLVVAALALPAACSSGSAEKRTDARQVTSDAGVVPACGSDVTPTCPSPKPSYKSDVVPILNADCNTCHVGGPSKPWPLTDYQSLLDWRKEVLGDMLQCTMPPEDAGHAISDADRGVLIGWLACGAPNN